MRLLPDVAAAIPIIVTGSMRAFDRDGWDGRPNLQQAIVAAQRAAPGVQIVFGSRLLHPELSVKVNPSVRTGIQPFGAGLLGTFASDCRLTCRARQEHLHPVEAGFESRPDAVLEYAFSQDSSPRQLEALLSVGPSACILEGFGDGNFPVQGARGAGFIDLIRRERRENGVLFVAVSQCAKAVGPSAYPGGGLLLKCGVLPGPPLGNAAAAAARLRLLFGMHPAGRTLESAWMSVLPGDVRITPPRRDRHGNARVIRPEPSHQNWHRGIGSSPHAEVL
jgi:L-asparaginase/Glu-tRNA(Gln) amidotransferase subunit D